MKTFLISVLLFCVVLILVICNALYIRKTTEELLILAESLPADADAFEAQYHAAAEEMDALYTLWDKSFMRLAFTTGYDNINRADDAMLSMYVNFENKSGEDFAVSRAIFCDGVRRLQSLESFSFHGIF